MSAPKSNMTPEEEAQWQATQRAGIPWAATPNQPIANSAPTVKRSRAWTVDELEEQFCIWQSQHPQHRDGFKFLHWLRRQR